jgi:thioredoxin-related protein
MKTKLNFRSVVFQRAHIIVKQTGCSFSQALAEAWKRYRNYKFQIVDEVSKLINRFDFYYVYADDSRVYRYWSAMKNEISKQIETLPKSFINAISELLNDSTELKSFI